jgi:hypothetical protein
MFLFCIFIIPFIYFRLSVFYAFHSQLLPARKTLFFRLSVTIMNVIIIIIIIIIIINLVMGSLDSIFGVISGVLIQAGARSFVLRVTAHNSSETQSNF